MIHPIIVKAIDDAVKAEFERNKQMHEDIFTMAQGKAMAADWKKTAEESTAKVLNKHFDETLKDKNKS